MQIYAFCLMDNHVHLIVKPDKKNSLAKALRVTHQRYALYLNKRLTEHGHCWQSRYYSCVVFGTHILKAIRYVENNPVRAGIVSVPWGYPWSSARAHFGKQYKIISLADIREYIKAPSWRKYLMVEDDKEDIYYLRQSTLQGKVYGPMEMIQDLQKRFNRRLLPRARGRPGKKL